jgi:hypothetical protein
MLGPIPKVSFYLYSSKHNTTSTMSRHSTHRYNPYNVRRRRLRERPAPISDRPPSEKIRPPPTARDLAIIPREERHDHGFGSSLRPLPPSSSASSSSSSVLPPSSDIADNMPRTKSKVILDEHDNPKIIEVPADAEGRYLE